MRVTVAELQPRARVVAAQLRQHSTYEADTDTIEYPDGFVTFAISIDRMTAILRGETGRLLERTIRTLARL